MTAKMRTTLGMETPRSKCSVASSVQSSLFLRIPLSRPLLEKWACFMFSDRV